jgi:PLP dependent protein
VVSVPNLRLVETVDSQKLAQKLNTECEKAERPEPLPVLVQVLTNLGEGTKFGMEAKEVPGLVAFIREECPKLRFNGLMSMGRLHD